MLLSILASCTIPELKLLSDQLTIVDIFGKLGK